MEMTVKEAAEKHGYLMRTKDGWTARGDCGYFSDEEVQSAIDDRSVITVPKDNAHSPSKVKPAVMGVGKFEPKPKPTNQERINSAIQKYDENEVKGLDAFNEILNKEPREDQTDEVPVGGGQKAKYVPIEHSETFLDQVFQEWSIENLRWSVEMNEVVVSLDVVVRHPITHDCIRRSGIGAAPVQQEKVYDPDHPKADKKKMRPATIEEFYKTKRINALHSAVPAAKAFAFNNAVKSLGERFGRNLNRDNRGLYKSIFTDLVEQQEEDEERKRALRFIEKVGPEKARESFSEEFLSNHPDIRAKLDDQ